MIRRIGFVAALALLVAGCGSGAADIAVDRDEAPPVKVSLSIQNGVCRATLNGEPGDGDALLARAVRVLEDFVRMEELQYGSVRELPAVLVLGTPDLPWRCAAGAIHQVQRAGFTRLWFSRQAALPLAYDLPLILEGVVRETDNTNRIVIQANGSFLWNGGSATAEQVSAHVRTMGTMRPLPHLEIRAEPAARYDEVLALLAQLPPAGIQLVPGEYSEVGVELADLERYAGELK